LVSREIADAPLTEEARSKAEERAAELVFARLTHVGLAETLGREIAYIVAGITPDQIERCRTGMLALARQFASPNTPVQTSQNELKTVEWAYQRWLAVREDGTETVDAARLSLDEFLAHSKIVTLCDLRRHHFVEWRESLQNAEVPLAANSINKRLQLVRAIIRVGWREAEFPQFDLADITLPVPEGNDRRALNRSEILAILQALASEPLWARWTFVIALTTSTRLSEILAARIGCFNHETGFIESRRDAVKGRRGRRKAHAMPILGYIREPFLRYIMGRPSDDFLLANAPRSLNTKLPAGHEASKWFGRFFGKNKLEVCFHETRDTWIHHARHSAIKRDLWEIISGHSEKCMSDRYGGEDPGVLLGVNERVCKFLADDTEVKAAIFRLVG
jgi:integrase